MLYWSPLCDPLGVMTPSSLRRPGKEDSEDNVQSPCSVWPELKVESKNMSCYRIPFVAISIVIPELITNLPPKKFLELCSPVSCWEEECHSWSGMWSRPTCGGLKLDCLTGSPQSESRKSVLWVSLDRNLSWPLRWSFLITTEMNILSEDQKPRAAA